MSEFKSYNDFIEETNPSKLGNISEGLFDKMFSWMKNIAAMFKNSAKMQETVEAVVTEAGDSGIKDFMPSTVGEKETYFVMLGEGENKFSVSLTKLGNMPDKAGLFQITGTTNEEMLKALTGSKNIEDLTKQSVMAVISDKSISKGKPMTMLLLKNIMKDKDYISENKVTGIAKGMDVEAIYNKSK